jgi:hypothetical protein
MKYLNSPVFQRCVAGLALAAVFLPCVSAAALIGFPFSDEDLAYSINWPSGLGLGESHVRARHTGADWKFELTIDAGIPGYQVKDLYNSVANSAFCSASFNRTISHGQRKTEEKEIIETTEVTRTTLKGGGESHLVAPDCVKDALTFLFFARRELGQGRVPPSQSILLGGLYPIHLDYAGEQTIKVGDQPTLSDKVLCTIKTASSEVKFEIYFARDPARTPLLVKVPFPVGSFSMELVR